MQNIGGNIASSVRHDNGDFENILGIRVRKELIYCYVVAGPIVDKDNPDRDGKYSVNFLLSNGWASCPPHTKEECEKEVERLDWMYKKDSNAEY